MVPSLDDQGVGPTGRFLAVSAVQVQTLISGSRLHVLVTNQATGTVEGLWVDLFVNRARTPSSNEQADQARWVSKLRAGEVRVVAFDLGTAKDDLKVVDLRLESPYVITDSVPLTTFHLDAPTR